MFSSIKAKILIYYMTVLFMVLSVLGISIYFSLNKIVYDSIDSSLLAKAKALATLTRADEEDRAEFRFSDEIMWEYSSPQPRSFFQIRRLDGSTVEKSASLKDGEFPKPGMGVRSTFMTIVRKDRTLRLINYPVPDMQVRAELGRVPGVVIQCAEDIESSLDLLEHFRAVLVGALLFVMFASALGGFIIAGKALAPVREISQTIDMISEHDLSKRISVQGVPRELAVLADSFNRTFSRLEKAFNRQDQFAADASHELRTPLSVIVSQSEITLRKERNTKEYISALSTVKEAAGTMSASIRELLTLARLRADKLELKYESVDIADIVNESIRLLLPLAAQKQVVIELSQSSDPALVRGDKSALLELFTNLLDNAVKYNVPRGKISVSVKKEENSIVCEVRDTGIGIPEDALDKVFDRFYRVDHSHSKKIDGSGLGLSICKDIVELHGGRIRITSKEREGTSVSVYLKV